MVSHMLIHQLVALVIIAMQSCLLTSIQLSHNYSIKLALAICIYIYDYDCMACTPKSICPKNGPPGPWGPISALAAKIGPGDQFWQTKVVPL